jgi:hypothetical protein
MNIAQTGANTFSIKMGKIKARLGSGMFALAILSGGSLLTAQPETTRDQLKEWVQLEREISREATAWEAEKAIIEDRIALYEAEKARLEAQIEEAEAGIDDVDSKRAELLEERVALQDVMALVEEPLEAFEARLRALYPQFPEPLQSEVSKLYQRLPEASGESPLPVTQRLQAVVGMLNFADKFNTGVQREVEIRSVEGRQMEVETLYFGLAGAWFADAQGTYAGFGQPGSEGWVWNETPESAEAISRMIAVYNGTREAVFTPVPVTLKP